MIPKTADRLLVIKNPLYKELVRTEGTCALRRALAILEKPTSNHTEYMGNSNLFKGNYKSTVRRISSGNEVIHRKTGNGVIITSLLP